MRVSLIVAVSDNWAIGLNNDLLWHYPADMRIFMKTTTGHHVLSGRKNFFSIPEKYRPLKNRTNLVLSRQDKLEFGGATQIRSIEEGIELAKKAGENELFIIGGGEIYKQCLQKGIIDRMYVTHVHRSFKGDTFFPEIEQSEWNVMSSQELDSDETSGLTATLKIYDKLH